MTERTRPRLGSRLMAGIVALVLAPACLGLLPTEAGAGALTAFTDDDLAHGFMATVFGAEYGGYGHVLKKYAAPVRFEVINSASVDRRPAVRAWVARLPKLIPGLNARMAKAGEKANFRVYVVDRADYGPLAQEILNRGRRGPVRGNCIATMDVGRNGIAGSTAVIASDRGEALFQRCLVEEILQGLGPMNDDRSLKASMFNDRSRHTRLTAFDHAILAALYDRRMRHGMSKEEAETVLADVLLRARKIAD